MDAGPDIEQTTTLAIIAGGEGRRMGGPKLRLRIGGRPILCDLIERLRWAGPTLLVVRSAEAGVEGQQLVDRVLADAVPGEGPLRGILTALESCATGSLVAVPIDMPGLRREHLLWLAVQARAAGCRRAFLRRQVDGREQVETLPAFFLVSGADEIRRRLAGGRRALHALADLTDTCLLDAPAGWGPLVWVNLNSPDDALAGGATLRRGTESDTEPS